jgi:hypothetical protein
MVRAKRYTARGRRLKHTDAGINVVRRESMKRTTGKPVKLVAGRGYGNICFLDFFESVRKNTLKMGTRKTWRPAKKSTFDGWKPQRTM